MGPPSTALARHLVNAVPERFSLVHEDADPRELYAIAVFDDGSARISATRYDDYIVHAPTTLSVALQEEGSNARHGEAGGVCYVVADFASARSAWLALPDGGVAVLSASVPLIGGGQPPLDAERFQQLVEDVAARLS